MVAVQERRQQARHRISKMGVVDDRRADLYVQQEISGKSLDRETKDRKVLEKEVKRLHPNLSREEVDDVVRSIVLKPGNDIKIGNEVVSYDEYAIRLADSIEQNASERTLRESITLKQKEIEDKRQKGGNTDDLSIRVADLIEIINAGTSTQEEYFDIIETGAQVIKDMNDGFVSQNDFDTKIAFLDRLDQREIELMRTLSLYSSSPLLEHNPEIKAKFDEYKQKLYKLREVRSAVKRNTKNKVDEKTTEKEYEQVKPYWLVFREVVKARRNKDYDGAEAARGKLRILLLQGNIPDHEKMALGMHPYDKIRDSLLMQELATLKLMSQNKMLMEKYDIQSEYLLVHHHENDTIDRVKSRVDALNKLRGISNVKDEVLSKQYRAQLQEKQFYKNNFFVLQKQNVNSIN